MIFFDLDDTLLDDRAATIAGLAALRRFRPETVDGDPRFLARWLALADAGFARYLAGDPEYQDHAHRRRKRVQAVWPDVGDVEASRVAADYRAAYEGRWTPFADVLPCLDALSPHRLGVISNGMAEQQLAKLQRTGLASRFAVIAISSEVGAAKPDPRIFAEACRRAGEAPASCWHVGDRLHADPLAAVAAGLRGIWLNRDPQRPGDPRVPTIRGLANLPALVRAAS